MPIDYSKWDKIELSDDSDIEVHPNVDKRSFIKWKQQSIHEQRMKRNQDIKNLETQIDMYSHLNKRVDKILASFTVENGKIGELSNIGTVTKFLNEQFDKNEKQAGDNVDPDIATYNEMVVDLFEQLKRDAKKESMDPEDGQVLKKLILKHREKIEKVTAEAKTKLDELYREKHAHISSEDIHTGFDSGFMNKGKDSGQSKEQKEKMDKAMKVIKSHMDAGENLLPKNLDLNVPLQFIEYKGEEDLLKLAPETEKFGELIPFSEYRQSEAYLLSNMPIISEQQRDALMMKSFEYQTRDPNSKMTYQIIHQAEILSYLREIYDLKKIPYLNVKEMEEVIKMFFDKVIFNKANLRGRESFLDSVKMKYEHVKRRSEVIKAEQEAEAANGGGDGDDNAEAVETIQLKSLDDSTTLEVNVPDFDSKDPAEQKRCELFKTLPTEMQEALRTKSLVNVNKVFATMPVEEAEKLLDIFNEADIIGIRAVLENEEDFNQIRQNYAEQHQEGGEIEKEDSAENDEGDNFVSTADTVD